MGGREASQQQQDAPCRASLCLPRLRLRPRWDDVASCMAGWGWKANRGIDQFLCLLTTNRKGSQLRPERVRHQVMADRPLFPRSSSLFLLSSFFFLLSSFFFLLSSFFFLLSSF